MRLILPIILLLAGCASHEPSIIALRNSSGRTLKSLRVQEVGANELVESRVGYVAPIRNGDTTFIERAEGAAPLPREAAILWPRSDGYFERIVVDLRPVLRDATGEPDEMLVFEVRGQAHAVAYLEQLSAP